MRSSEYQGTRLLQDTAEAGTFLVIDRWVNGDSVVLRFRQEFSDEYEELDRECLELTEEETRIGAFDEFVCQVPPRLRAAWKIALLRISRRPYRDSDSPAIR